MSIPLQPASADARPRGQQVKVNDVVAPRVEASPRLRDGPALALSALQLPSIKATAASIAREEGIQIEVPRLSQFLSECRELQQRNAVTIRDWSALEKTASPEDRKTIQKFLPHYEANERAAIEVTRALEKLSGTLAPVDLYGALGTLSRTASPEGANLLKRFQQSIDDYLGRQQILEDRARYRLGILPARDRDRVEDEEHVARTIVRLRERGLTDGLGMDEPLRTGLERILRETPAVGIELEKALVKRGKIQMTTWGGESAGLRTLLDSIRQGNRAVLASELQYLSQFTVGMIPQEHTGAMKQADEAGRAVRLSIQRDLGRLLDTNPVLNRLGARLRAAPTSENLAAFVSAFRQASERKRYDVPGVLGNAIFQGKVTDEDRYAQLGCQRVSDELRYLVDELKSQKILPPTAVAFPVYNQPGTLGYAHWATAVSIDDLTPGFIVDPWRVAPGQRVPCFSTYKEWVERSRDAVREEGEAIAQRLEVMRAACTIPSIRNSTINYAGGDILDMAEPLQQDFVIRTLFLRDPPAVPRDALEPDLFQAFRARVASVTGEQGAGQSTSLDELLPFARKYLASAYPRLKGESSR